MGWKYLRMRLPSSRSSSQSRTSSSPILPARSTSGPTHSLAIRTAFDVFEEQVNRPKLTTGHGDLDSLIGGILPGTFTLLYGEQEILSLLVHKLLANCALPEGKGGFDGEAIYFNHTNYYAAKTILDPSLLGQVAKHVGID